MRHSAKQPETGVTDSIAGDSGTGFSREVERALHALYQPVTYDCTLKHDEGVLLLPEFAGRQTGFASLLTVLRQTLRG